MSRSLCAFPRYYVGNFITVLTVTFVVYFILALAVFDAESIGDRKLIPEGNLQVHALRDAVQLVTFRDSYTLGGLFMFVMRHSWLRLGMCTCCGSCLALNACLSHMGLDLLPFHPLYL